jgi:hypothetical protein
VSPCAGLQIIEVWCSANFYLAKIAFHELLIFGLNGVRRDYPDGLVWLAPVSFLTFG